MAAGMIAVSCPECGTSIRLHEADWEEGIPCPGCTAEIRKPSEEELLDRELAELKDELKALDDDFVRLGEEGSELQAKTRRHQQAARDFERECRELEARLDDASSPSASTDGTQRIAELEQRLAQVNEEIRLTKAKAKDQLERLTERADRAVRERIDRAADQMSQTYNVSRKELLGELDQVTKEADVLRGDLARRQQEVEEQERETKELNARLKDLSSFLRIAREAAAKARARIAEIEPDAANINAVTKEELERMRTTNERLKKQLPTIQDHHERLEAYQHDLSRRLAARAAETAPSSPPPTKAPSKPPTVRLKPLKHDE